MRARRRTPATCLAWALGLAVGLLATPALSGPLPCPGGTFWLPRPPDPIGDPIPGAPPPISRIVVEGSQVSLFPTCGPTQASLRASKAGTRIRAKWPGCSGFPANLSLDATIDAATCGTLTGSIRPKRLSTIRVTATTAAGESLRFATYNTQMLPSHFNATTSTRSAARMAERIIASGYDFIALNEVFDEDIRRVLVRRLRTVYPHYVSYLHGGTVPHEDSALALFSRFPFVTLPNDTFQTEREFCAPGGGPCTITSECKGSDCSKVAFVEFDACEGDDCLAEKGAGLVRIQNPETGRIYNVAFTHTQASYPAEDYEDDAYDHYVTRGAQLAQVRELVEVTLGARTESEDVFLLGDLNVDGDLLDADRGLDPYVYLLFENLFEWKDRFAGAGFFASFLRDAWAFESAPLDPVAFDRGLTNPYHWASGSDGARLDYVLRNTTYQQPLCAQHLTLAHNLRWSPPEGPFTESGLGLAGREKLSDHLGVNADMNLMAPQCRPADAKRLVPAPGVVVSEDGVLEHRGSVQWFRIDEPGTHAIAVLSGNGTDFRVYEASDLSTPVAQYKGETSTVASPGGGQPGAARKFRSDEPFYVKVFHPSRSATGGYTLLVLRQSCASRESACALAPGQALEHTLAPAPPASGPDEAWFELNTEAHPAGRPQHVRFLVDRIHADAADAFRLELYASDGITPLGAATAVPDPEVTEFDAWKLELAGDIGGRQAMYMVVKRYAPPSLPPPVPYPPGATTYRVRWLTNLSILFGVTRGGHPLEVYCQQENDGVDLDGDDEVHLDRVLADGEEVVGHHFLGNFDAGDPRSLEAYFPGPVYFFDAVEVFLREFDNGTAFGDDQLSYPTRAVPALSPDVARLIGGRLGMESPTDYSGWYVFHYNLTHGFDD